MNSITENIRIYTDRTPVFPSAIASFPPSSNIAVFPGFVDVHVHLREPGFVYKETIATGTASAAAGGYTDIFSMPNLSPVPDCLDNLRVQLDVIERDAKIRVVPYASITRGEAGKELADMDALAPYVCGFSDDGRGVQDDGMMRAAMEKARQLQMPIVAHCEDNSLLNGGYIHDGKYAKAHGHRGICSESEWRQIERDLKLVSETGCKYHVCHISAKESVELIRDAKKSGIDVTCETGPHYLLLDDSMLQEDGRFKMNPPIRDAADRFALVEGLLDGTVDMIATDHAPHSAEEKSRGLEKSTMGIVGLETSFPVLYTELVLPGILTIEKLIDLMSRNPRRRFNIDFDESTNYTVFDLSSEYVVDPSTFRSMGRATPFEGKRVLGKCILTVCSGSICHSACN